MIETIGVKRALLAAFLFFIIGLLTGCDLLSTTETPPPETGPTSTSTAVPPTDTAVPSTDTAVPPTDTPEPTNTPTPTPTPAPPPPSTEGSWPPASLRRRRRAVRVTGRRDRRCHRHRHRRGRPSPIHTGCRHLDSHGHYPKPGYVRGYCVIGRMDHPGCRARNGHDIHKLVL